MVGEKGKIDNDGIVELVTAYNLPDILVKEIQKYVDGQLIYIPRKNEHSLSWGEKSGTRDKLAERNRAIVNRYYSGETVVKLSEVYYLSEKSSGNNT